MAKIIQESIVKTTGNRKTPAKRMWTVWRYDLDDEGWNADSDHATRAEAEIAATHEKEPTVISCVRLPAILY